MFNNLTRFATDEQGATAVEYGLIAALVSVACVAALGSIGTSVAAVFELVQSNLAGTAPAGLD